MLTLASHVTVPIAVVLGVLFPTVLGATYSDTIGGFIYPGLVCRILSTFQLYFWEAKEVTRQISLALHIFCQLVWVYATFPHTYTR